ncbi:MAG TPA: hypothetical protein VHM02_15400, partial [Thermoanaerobaculia bacterium]|nr:hypothetical protein [Thermoanaerobaculia bacterium]
QGIPMWVWILVLILVVAILWWILAGSEEPAATGGEPLTEAPTFEEPGDAGFGEPLATDTGFGTGTELGTEPIDVPPPPAP